jgi:pimeloyl-ACP methyl ester carboxylesterase
LEVDTSAAFAYGLSDPKIWRSEFAGFLSGDYFAKDRFPIDGLEPYRPGQIPVVFIHGTGSSSGRWADLVNDLQSDPTIREHFQFWWFSYSTGNPAPYSALRLRTAIEDALHKIDPQGRDPALRQIVLIGHSQGGLLAKMLVIDSGSRIWDAFSSKPLEELTVSAETRDLLRRAAFVTPLPEVRRVIFIATPQHGSFVAGSTIGQLLGRLVTLPANVVTALGETIGGNPDAAILSPGSAGFGSVWSMTPDNPALKAFAAIPVSPKVSAHSIIAVEGDGPVETGDDGVVTYQSAHIPEAKSELVVRSSHSVQANPHTVSEVRRILLLHLAEACPKGCAPAAGHVAGLQR